MGDKQKTKQVQDNSVDPWSRQMYETGAGRVRSILNQPAQPYTGNRVAGLSDLEQQAAARFSGGIGAGSDVMRSAIGSVEGLEYSPQQINAGSLGDIMSSGGLEKYMDPYIQDVIDPALMDLDRTRQGAINQGQTAATAAGAFGGSRHGVADSLTNEAALREAGSLSSNLRSGAFDRAAGYASSDLDRSMNEQVLNNQFGGDAARFGMDRAGLLGSMGGALGDMNARDAFAMAAFGENARNIDQAELDAAYEQYINQQNDMYNRAGLELGLLGSTPIVTDSRGSSTTQQSPGAASILGTGAQIASMFSDSRLKTDIAPAGHMHGYSAYTFRYVWDEPGDVRCGVMAQDVLLVNPAAVSVSNDGHLMVNYGAL